MPAITEQLEPGRTILMLSFEKTGDKKSAINAKVKETIIAYLTDHAEPKAASIAEYIGLKPSRTRDYLKELLQPMSVTRTAYISRKHNSRRFGFYLPDEANRLIELAVEQHKS